MAKVGLKNVRKSYGSADVVKGITLDVVDGEFVVLVGPSGCGKSTTLRMIAGLESITSGEIIVGETRVNDIPPQKRNMAMVFQNYALYPHKTVAENITFGLKKQSLEKSVVASKLKEVAEMLQLEDYLHRKPAALSGGQRQRVAMGRAIIRDVDVLLFDEPLSNLDAKLRHHMRTEIRRLHKRLGVTSIYVTHDQVEAMTLADRICVLRDGMIEQTGAPMEIYSHPANLFVATFIGSPAMNIISARLDKGSLVIGSLELELPLELQEAADQYMTNGGSKEVHVGIRPEFAFDLGLMQVSEAREDTDGNSLIQSLGRLFVDVVEPMGFDQEVTVALGSGGEKLLCKLNLKTTTSEGDTIEVGIDMNKVHIFDLETGENIRIQRTKSVRSMHDTI